jgi:hypothetical protein
MQPNAEKSSSVIDARAAFAQRRYLAQLTPQAPIIFIPERVIAPYRAQWLKRGPEGVDIAKATPLEVAQRACALPYTYRSRSKATKCPQAALTWAASWLQAGCPGVALPRPREAWRAARMRSGGVALYRRDWDDAYLWLDAPPWMQAADSFEEISYESAVKTLQGAAQ